MNPGAATPRSPAGELSAEIGYFRRMNQLPLFRQDRPEPERRPPDLVFIRKSLNRLLRTLRDAEFMPWSEDEAQSWERQFPKLAAYFPAEEAESMMSEFTSELARLRATS